MQDYDQKTIDVVNQLFRELFAIKPAFKQSFETQEDLIASKRQWMLAFQENNIESIEKLKFGLKNLRGISSPFFPSPGEFIGWCKPSPEDLGIPSVEDAYKEACMKSHPQYGPDKNWSHEVVRLARDKTGSHWLRTEPTMRTFPAFKKHYEQCCEMYADGKNLNQIEDDKKDSFENRQAYQEYFGWRRQLRTLDGESPPILSYEDWLKNGKPK